MRKADMHIHSMFSPDADRSRDNSVASICESALAAGMSYIAITDHYDIDGPQALNSDIPAIEKSVFAAKEIYARRGLVPLFGLELAHANQYPDRARQICKGYPFDFLLGSLHQTTGRCDFYSVAYDRLSDSELRGLYETYLSELLEISATCDFDSLAHCTYPLRYYTLRGRAGALNFRGYEDAYAEIFKTLIHRGKALEINTSGMREQTRAPFPPLSLVRLYASLGGTLLTVGSDAHEPTCVGAGIQEICEKIKQIGFRYVTVYKDRKPIGVRI